MQTSNKIEISYAVSADMVNQIIKDKLDDYVKTGMITALAEEIIDTYPVEVTLDKPKLGHGYSDETHKITLFIFSEQQMDEHDKEIRKNAFLSLAVDKALHTLGEKVCH